MTLELLCCEIGSREYAVRAEHARAIARAEQIRMIGGADGRVGLLPHGKVLVPVFWAGAYVGEGTHDSKTQGHVVIAGSETAQRGWWFSRVQGRATIEPTDLAALPEALGPGPRRMFSGLVTSSDRPFLVFNVLDALGARPATGGPACETTKASTADASRPDAEGRPAAGPDERRGEGTAPLLIAFRTDAVDLPQGTFAALSASQVAEVLSVSTIVPVPGAPRGIRGLVSWRGRAVPVVDLSGGSSDSETAKVIIARERRGTRRPLFVAIPIAGDARLMRVTPEQRRIVSSVTGVALHGLFARDAETIGLINVAGLVKAAAESVGKSDDGVRSGVNSELASSRDTGKDA